MNLILTPRTSEQAFAPVQVARRAAHMVLALLVCMALLAGAGEASAQELQKRFEAYDPGSSRKLDHSPWDRLLKTYLREGKGPDALNRVNYGALKSGGMAELKKYLSYLQSVDVARLARPEQLAYWTNLYNAKTIEIVARNYPVASIRDIRLGGPFTVGPWKAKVVTVSGVKLSLDDIEHGIMRPIWRDARIHYAVNCAAYTCPNLEARAFTGDSLEAMLDKAARAYINSSRAIAINGSRVTASSLYQWYMGDFGGSAEQVLAHLRKYAGPALAKRISAVTTIDRYNYSWILNDAQ